MKRRKKKNTIMHGSSNRIHICETWSAVYNLMAKLKRCKVETNLNDAIEKRRKKNARKTKIISIRIEDSLYNKLTKAAENDNMFVGELCRNFIKGGLENEQNQHTKESRQKNL